MVGLLTLLLTLSLAGTLPGAFADDLKHKEKRIGRAIHRAANDVHESSGDLRRARARLSKARARLATAQSALNRTQSRLQVARAHDARMQAALAAANAKLQKARAELAQAEQQVLAQRDAMGQLVARNYQYGDPQLMGLVAMLKSGTPREVTSQMNTMHNLMNRQASMLDSLRAAEAKAEELEQQTYEMREDVEARKVAAAKVVKQREALEQQASAARSKVAGLVSARRGAESSAKRVLARDRAILRKLKREQDKIRTLLMGRAQGGGGYSGRESGFLMRPVPGAVTSPFGYRTHPIYGYYGLHDGTDFSTPCGQNMAAVGSGTVVARYWSDVYGNRLVLDLGRVNGKSLAAVYNHASGYRVGVGQRVARGQVVGDAGNTGWSTGCHLHFTVLVNGNAVDPMRWF